MIARATAAMAPISTSLRGPIIKYGASCLTELIKTFLEKEPLFSSIDLFNDVEEQRLNNLG